MQKHEVRNAVLAVALLFWAGPAWAQSRPLVTEDPETVGPGQVLFEAGVDFLQDQFYPASGLRGRLFRVGTFGFSFGVSSMAEIQVDGAVQDLFSIKTRLEAPLANMVTATGDHTSDFPDATIGAKVRLMAESETRPSLAIRFATKLPNEGNESGLGTDTTDFTFAFLAGKTVQSVRIVGNFGFAILGDPVRGDRQNDVIVYGFSAARAIAPGVEMVGELNGRQNTRSGTPPIATDSRSIMRLGSRFTRGPVRIDGAVIVGVTQRDPTWGFTAGLTWVFTGFKVP